MVVSVAFVSLARADDDDKPPTIAALSGGAALLQPAGALVKDTTTGKAAVGSLPVDFIRSPDDDGPDGKGRYLIAVNSGYGIQFDAKTSRGQQSLAVIDLMAKDGAAVVQNVYFPSPQSAQVGAVFGEVGKDETAPLFVSGGFENKVWQFRFTPGAEQPISPGSPGPDTKVDAPFIDVSSLADAEPTRRYNGGRAAVYPLGLAWLGSTLFTANDLDDSLGIITPRGGGTAALKKADLHRNPEENIYPYGVTALPFPRADGTEAAKVYVSLWNAAAVAVFEWPPVSAVPRPVTLAAQSPPETTQSPGSLATKSPPRRIATGSHPTALLLDGTRRRLFVANSNADSVSVIDTGTDKEVERIDVRLTETQLPGVSPEGLALSGDGKTLYVALARADAVAVVRLGGAARGEKAAEGKEFVPSRLAGLIPTGRYPSALAVVGKAAGSRQQGLTTKDTENTEAEEEKEGRRQQAQGGKKDGNDDDDGKTAERKAGGSEEEVLFIGNGKGTGTENSSNVPNLSGQNPNAPDADYPANGKGLHLGRGGAYSVSVMSGNVSAVPVPDEEQLKAFTAQVLRESGLTGEPKATLFAGRPGGSPIKHVIYLIKENRTYDQVFGDLKASGDGTPADGQADLAIFGSGEAARRAGGGAQDITPNQHALAERFGLMDRFFVNSEASADGHNWSTAAFSTDYVDKVFRWNYSRRGRSYDFEGFNRLPDTGSTGGEPVFPADVTADTMANYLRKYLPYTHGDKDVGEPATLYLWDLAARGGLSYRTYGEFVDTASADDVAAARARRHKAYPDTSPIVVAVPAKARLKGHFCPESPGFDLDTPDALSVESYRAAAEERQKAEGEKPTTDGGTAEKGVDPMISPLNVDARWRGTSRMGAFLGEFARSLKDQADGKGDTLPALNIVRLSNDHTAGMSRGKPTPQFDVADNDYALGRLVEAVSQSPYWKDTTIVAVEDDAQDGPDHVDCHRSVALIMSAYNRPGALVHSFHTTAGLIRTMELMLGLPPMNAQDAAAAPIDLFQNGEPDLTPFHAKLPTLNTNGLITPRPETAPDQETAAAIRQSDQIDWQHPDDGDPRVLNAAIWASVRGASAAVPSARHLPVYDLMRSGVSATGASGADGDDDD